MAEIITITPKHCKRCGFDWIPKGIKVNICPWCKSEFWDVEPPEGYRRLGKKAPKRNLFGKVKRNGRAKPKSRKSGSRAVNAAHDVADGAGADGATAEAA